MWEKALCGLAMANLDNLNCYQHQKTNNGALEKNIRLFVKEGVHNLPLFFSLPLKTYAFFISLFSLATAGHWPDSLFPAQRKKLIRRLQWIPFFGILNKLVRAMVLLRLFDLIQLSQEENNEKN